MYTIYPFLLNILSLLLCIDISLCNSYGVCITGQMGRLELETKVSRILRPLWKRKDKVDIVLVLSASNNTIFVNGNKTENQILYNTTDDIINFLSPYARKVVPLMLEQGKDPVLLDRYVKKLGKPFQVRAPDRETAQAMLMELLETKAARAKVHVRQWYNFKKCYDMFRDLEFEFKKKYDAVVRVRDDGYLIETIDPQIVINPPRIVISSFDSWSGYNDKGAMMSRELAENYFNGFLDLFYIYNDKLLDYEITIPEQYTKAVFTHYKFNVTQNASEFSQLPARVCTSSSVGRCFRIFYKHETSGPCYFKYMPDKKKFIKANTCHLCEYDS
jgi:hypothetical protein